MPIVSDLFFEKEHYICQDNFIHAEPWWAEIGFTIVSRKGRVLAAIESEAASAMRAASGARSFQLARASYAGIFLRQRLIVIKPNNAVPSR